MNSPWRTCRLAGAVTALPLAGALGACAASGGRLAPAVGVARDVVAVARGESSEAAWQRAVDALGITVIEPDRHLVGDSPGNTKTWPLANDILGFGNNWYPIDVERKTLCGHVDRWSMFEHWASGDEHDLHAHLLPFGPFEYLLEDARIVAAKIDTNDVGEGLVYSELTPHKSVRRGDGRLFDASRWGLPRDPVSLPSFGRLTCAYGPWVREKAHANISEIHPSEAVWGTGPGHDGERTRTLVLLRDQSDRFTKPSQYATVPGAWWKPWSGDGVVVVTAALLALEGQAPIVTLSPLRADDRRPATRLDVEADGLRVRVVNETAVGFTVALRPAARSGPERRALLALRTKVGRKDLVAVSLRVEEGRFPPLPVAPVVRPLAEGRVERILMKNSMRRRGGRIVGCFASDATGREPVCDQEVGLGGVSAAARLDPSTRGRTVRLPVAVLPQTSRLWGMNPQAPGREWTIAPDIRAELLLELRLDSAARGSAEALTEELARVLKNRSRRREVFEADRPFVVNWMSLGVREIESGRRFDAQAFRRAGGILTCYAGELGTVGSCFEMAVDAARVLTVGVLGGFVLDATALAPTQPPTLEIVVEGRIRGPLGELPFKSRLLNHGPGAIPGGRLEVPRSWQLDADGLVPGLLDGLARAAVPADSEGLVTRLRAARADAAALEGLSRRLLQTAEQDAVLTELAAERGRRARMFWLYARALSAEGSVSDCSDVAPPCGGGPGSAPGTKRPECDRLRDLVCAFVDSGPVR